MQDHGLICLSQATAKGTGATVSRVCSFAVFVGAGTSILVYTPGHAMMRPHLGLSWPATRKSGSINSTVLLALHSVQGRKRKERVKH